MAAGRRVVVDFEFALGRGAPPRPHCVAAYCLESGEQIVSWIDDPAQDLLRLGDGDTMIAHAAQAELVCLQALGWGIPGRVVDTYAEARASSNSTRLLGQRADLLTVLESARVLHAYGRSAKSDLQVRAGEARCGDLGRRDRLELLAYCWADVDALRRYVARVPIADLATYRGEYVMAVAEMEARGVPLCESDYLTLRRRWNVVRWHIAADTVGRYHGVYRVGPPGAEPHFCQDGFERWIQRRDIKWPRLPSGKLKLDEEAWDEMKLAHPQIERLADAHKTLNRLRHLDMHVSEGRNRASLRPWRSRTGRCQPSPSEFVFGASKWLRSVIQAPPGHAVAYVDWVSAEIGIAAALSGDPEMIAAYATGDPYLWLAKRARAVPPDATKQSHPFERKVYKRVMLAVGYGQGPIGLASALGKSVAHAEALLAQHRRFFRQFWKWSDDVAATAALRRKLALPCWSIRVDHCATEFLSAQDRSIRNWVVQAACGEVLRCAVVQARRAGLKMIATVHDAIAIEAPIPAIDRAVGELRAIMSTAAEEIVGIRLETDAQVARHPERLSDDDEASRDMWSTVASVLRLR